MSMAEEGFVPTAYPRSKETTTAVLPSDIAGLRRGHRFTACQDAMRANPAGRKNRLRPSEKFAPFAIKEMRGTR
jgi:hypothetical protein